MTVHSSDVHVSRAQPLDTYPTTSGVYGNILKRALDILLVLAALPILLPFFAVVCIFVSMDGHSPFFRQERVGLNGKRFKIWKFRTMVPNAEAKLQAYLDENPDARAEWDEMQKLDHDPRITTAGRVLRRTSLDELPQLFNVLAGDMSLVGPRPMMPSQQALYPGQGYYRLRPGLTGSWQVSERNKSTFAERAIYDDSYEASLSFMLDMNIIFRTIGVVLRCTGK